MSGHSTRWLFQSTHSSWNTEIWNVGFCRGRESRRPREKTLGVRTRTKHQLNPHWTPGPGIKPGPQ